MGYHQGIALRLRFLMIYVVLLLVVLPYQNCSEMLTIDGISSHSSLKDSTDDLGDDSMEWHQTWLSVPIRTKPQRTAGLDGGEGMQQIFGIAYAPSNPNVVYMVTDTSQVWKSVDGGTTWKMKHNGFDANGGYCLAVDPNNENIVLVYANRMDADGQDLEGSRKGIYRTSDGGENWTLVRSAAIAKNPGQASRGGTNIAFVSSSIVFAGSQGEGLFKSSDGGNTWSQISLAEIDGDTLYDLKVHPDDASILFVSSETDKLLYKITGGGSAITPIGDGLPQNPTSIVISGNHNGDLSDDTLYAVLGRYGVYKSTDSGARFAAANSGLAAALTAGARAIYLGQSPVDPNYLYVNFDKAKYYYSHSGGDSWVSATSMDELNADGWISGSQTNSSSGSGGDWWSAPVTPHPSDKNIALTVGGSDQVKKTFDGGTRWKYSSSGYTGGRAGGVASNSDAISYQWDKGNRDRMVVFLADFGPFLTTDSGSIFRNLGIPRYFGQQTTWAGAFEPVAGSELIVTAVGTWKVQKIAVTRNADAKTPSWVLVDNTDDNYSFIAFNPQDTNIIYAGKYKSLDKGFTWLPQAKKIIAMYQGDGNTVYASEVLDGATVIFKSTDGGINWIAPYPSIPAVSSIKQITVAPNNPDKLYLAVANKGLYIIDGASISLKNDSNGLTRDRFNSISTALVAVDPNHSNILYVGAWNAALGAANGVFRSIDEGNTWENITFNLGPEFNTWSLIVNPHDGFVYVGSSHGTWKLPPP